MNIRTKVEIIVGGIVFVVIVVGTVFAVEAHVARVKAEAIADAQQQIIKKSEDSIKLRDRQLQAMQDSLNQQIEQLKTVAQARTALQPIIIQSGTPSAPAAPIASQQVTKAELPANVQKSLPDAPGSTKYSLLTDQQMIDLGKFKLSCDETSGNLLACKADEVDTKSELAAMTKERDTFKAASKGGTWIHRTLKALEVIGCSGAGAYLGGRSKHSNGPVVGAVAGSAACQIFLR
jgi:hypothetical protein